MGGSRDDFGADIAVDTTGGTYVTGVTESSDFPTVQPLQSKPGGGRSTFVAKLKPDGTALVYATYLGGGSLFSEQGGSGIAVDATGAAYVTGTTGSADFPTTPGAFQEAFGGGAFDAFVAKLTPDGTALAYATYLGGSGQPPFQGDGGAGIAVDAAGAAYVTGTTRASDFPTTAGAFQAALACSNSSIFCQDAFVAKLRPDGKDLVYATYLGGRGSDSSSGIAVDTTGAAYVTGETDSPDFPTTPGAFQDGFLGAGIRAFVAKLTPEGSALVYATYLQGGRGFDIAVDTTGAAYVTGEGSPDFPILHALQSTFGGIEDAFVAKLTPDGTALVYATLLGGRDFDIGLAIALDATGAAYVTGDTGSPDFPIVHSLQPRLGGERDAFVAKLIPSHIVNDLVMFIPIESTFNTRPTTTGCPSGFVGEFNFSARLTDKESSPSISNLVANVTTLTSGNLLRNADAGPGGVGNTLTIPRTGNFSDGVLTAGEFVDVPFSICLKNQESFNFFVDVHVLE